MERQDHNSTGIVRSNLFQTNLRYLVSYLINRIGQVLILPVDLCSVTALRALNLFLVCFILPLIMRRLYRLIHEKASEDAIALAGLLPAFPLLSFFGNLYYTDVLSTTTVLYCYLLAVEKRYILSSLVHPSLRVVLIYPGRRSECVHKADQRHMGCIHIGGVRDPAIEGSRYSRQL